MPDQLPAPQAQQPAQAAPFGASPVSQPAPNRGYEAAALQKLGLAGKLVQEALSMAGFNSDVGKASLKILQDINKLTASNDSNPASDRRSIEQLAMKNTQAAQMMQQMKTAQAQQAQGGGGQPGAGGPPGAGGGNPMAAMMAGMKAA